MPAGGSALRRAAGQPYQGSASAAVRRGKSGDTRNAPANAKAQEAIPAESPSPDDEVETGNMDLEGLICRTPACN
jgi:hypothetical protein